MSESTVWVQATDLDRLRTWHLQGVPGETLCDRSTRAMKAMPRAEWRQVLNPCPSCLKSADATDAVAEFQDVVDDPQPHQPGATDLALGDAEPADAEPEAPEPRVGKHVRRD